MVNLRIRRVEANVTQEELHMRSGVSRATISRIERDGYIPSVSVAKRIASALDFNWRDFYSEPKS